MHLKVARLQKQCSVSSNLETTIKQFQIVLWQTLRAHCNCTDCVFCHRSIPGPGVHREREIFHIIIHSVVANSFVYITSYLCKFIQFICYKFVNTFSQQIIWRQPEVWIQIWRQLEEKSEDLLTFWRYSEGNLKTIWRQSEKNLNKYRKKSEKNLKEI